MTAAVGIRRNERPGADATRDKSHRLEFVHGTKHGHARRTKAAHQFGFTGQALAGLVSARGYVVLKLL
jgi:hypothetical protein